MIKSDIAFLPKRGNQVKFSVIHNLDEYGLDIHNAIFSWAARTKRWTCESFCEYIKDKDTHLKCEPA